MVKMSKYTLLQPEDECITPQPAPRTRIRSTSIPRPMRPLERPKAASQTVKKSPTKSHKDNTISERYTNTSFSQIRSPKVKIQTIPTTMKECGTADQQSQKTAERGSERKQAPKPSPRTLIEKEKCNVISKRHSLYDENSRNEIIPSHFSLKPRPKTSHCSRTESRMQQQVFGTIKKVLSQAVVQQGKIDETNIETIISSMRSRLNLDDEDFTEIDIEEKPSRTILHRPGFVEKRSSIKIKNSVAGIIRKDGPVIVPKQKHYRKIYDQFDSPSEQSLDQNRSQGDDSFSLPVDLSRTSHVATKSKCTQVSNFSTTESKSVQHTDGLSEQFEMGDFQTKKSGFWSSLEDAKLQAYVESLIQNMKTQINTDSSDVKTEDDSKATSSRTTRVIKSKPTHALKQKPPVTKEPVVNTKTSKPLKSTVLKSKPTKTDEPLAVAKKSALPKTSFDKCEEVEESDDKYLQVRIDRWASARSKK
ncbi:uncharacterized protein LOC128990624 isoform X1 [Macrosteles quadrilineatus]|uniref:uncharacterized protein LOC128990624 isoform X1 n=2 Tax=Macrosteles quadrilineatus TaxID=74068 RepID=UPI0023E1E544|nr:uncharacterized protein LOC128990624 isoform X1 [Macrosteles quadrilineatus]